MQHTAEYFDSLYKRDPDPWKFKSRWYEFRKRALTLACLPQFRYASAYEPGCANGELSAALAGRCDRLVVSDGSALAVAMASERLHAHANVEVMHVWVPAQWPAETFDLVVLSEFGFYLDGPSLDALADRVLASLRQGATVLACHWRRPIDGCALDGDEVHQRLERRLALPRISQLLEPDMRLDVWCADPLSVAQREGFA